MASVYEQGGIIYVVGGPADLAQTSSGFGYVEYGGITYFFHPATGWYYKDYDERGMMRVISASNIRFIAPVHTRQMLEFEYPSLIDVKPRTLWPQVTQYGMMGSFAMDAKRWVRVMAFLDRSDGSVSIPIADSEGIPWLDPAIPPMGWCRKHISNTDRVWTPGTTSIAWTDAGCYGRAGTGIYGPTTQTVEWALKPSLDPVPHWVLQINTNTGAPSANQLTVLIDLFGQMCEPQDSPETSVEEGASGTVGHYRIEKMWTGQAFGSVSDRTILNERLYGVGAVDVENDPTGATSRTLYLNDGSPGGGAGDTTVFSHGSTAELPAVLVLGNADLNTWVARSAKTTWKPESWGLGAGLGYAAGAVGIERAYDSEVSWDGSDFKVVVRNLGEDGTGTANSALDRTFFAFAFGR